MPKAKRTKLERRVVHLGECLARSTVLVQTQDGEIGRLTALNDRLFAIIDKMITGGPDAKA